MGVQIVPTSEAALSGERFRVRYRIGAADQAEALERARDICLEQTVEFPDALVPAGFIRDQILGRIEQFEQSGKDSFLAEISYAVELVGGELPQLLNVLFGNISIKPLIRIEAIALAPALEAAFPGPRFGVAGLRERLGVTGRPLLCTALKPQGLSAADLANLAHGFALGGIDIVKDDHGLANQAFSTFRERVQRCAEAVQEANAKSGEHSVYAPHIAGPHDQILERAHYARDCGAGALLVSPGLIGWDAVRGLSQCGLDLPLIAHPALLGSFVTSPASGIAHRALFGQLMRIAGADASIYPNFGGRFSFSRDECLAIAEGCSEPLGNLKPIFPTPGGGMSLARIPDMREAYGQQVIYLVGGGLLLHGPDLVANCRHFRHLVESD